MGFRYERYRSNCRNQAVTLKTPSQGSMSEMAILQQLSEGAPLLSKDINDQLR
jgi:hypothetical protein